MANTSNENKMTAGKMPSKRTQEELIAGFNMLRHEQRNIAGKIYELDNDLSEHKIVIENLQKIDENRKCYRLIGGILVESTVKDVLPNLNTNSEQLKNAIENLNTKLVEKGKEILEFKEKNNIQIQIPDKIMEEDETEGNEKAVKEAVKT